MKEAINSLGLATITAAILISFLLGPIRGCSDESVAIKFNHQRTNCEKSCERTKYEKECFVVCMSDYRFAP